MLNQVSLSGWCRWGGRGGGRPCYELGSKVFRDLQGHLAQPNFPAQETDAQGSQVLSQRHMGLVTASELVLVSCLMFYNISWSHFPHKQRKGEMS